MLYIKQGFPSRHNDIYIKSIKRKFQPKSSKISQKRFKTSPQRPFFSPIAEKILKRYQTLNIRQLQDGFIEHKLPYLKSSSCHENDKKRWSQIEKEQYDSIKQQITVSKNKIMQARPNNKRCITYDSPQRHYTSSLIETNIIKQSQPIKDRLLSKESWLNHMRNLNKNRRQSFLKNNSGYLFPELFAKLPKINAYKQEENFVLAKSMELKNSQQSGIFCSRQSKRSQIKLQAQKLGDLVKRRKMRTLNYESIDSQIAPWKQSSSITNSLL